MNTLLFTLLIGVIASLFYSFYQSKSVELDAYKFESDKKLKELQADLQSCKQKLENIDKSTDVLIEDKLKKHQQQVEGLESELKQLSESKTTLSSEIENTKKLFVEATKLKDNLALENATLQSKLEAQEGEIAKLDTKYRLEFNSKMEEHIVTRDYKINELQRENQDLKNTLDERTRFFNEAVDASAKKVSDYERRMGSLETTNREKDKIITKLEAEIKEFSSQQDNIKDLEGKTSEFDKILAQLEVASVTEIPVLVAGLKEKLANKEADVQNKQLELNEVNKKLQHLSEDVTSDKGKLEAKLKEASDSKQLLEIDLQECKDKLASITYELESKSHDFKLYDIVKSKYQELYNKVVQIVPEIEEVELEEESYEVVEYEYEEDVEVDAQSDVETVPPIDIEKEDEPVTKDITDGKQEETTEEEKDQEKEQELSEIENNDESEQEQDETKTEESILKSPVKRTIPELKPSQLLSPAPVTVSAQSPISPSRQKKKVTHTYIHGNEETQIVQKIFKGVQKKVKDLERSIQDKQEEINLVNNKYKAIQDTLSQRDEGSEKQRVEIKKLEDELTLAKNLYDGSKNQLIDTKLTNEKLSQKLTELEKTFEVISTKNKELIARQDEIEKVRRIQDQRMITDAETLKQKSEQVEQLSRLVDEFKGRVKSLTQDLETNNSLIAELQAQVLHYKTKFTTIMNDLQDEDVAPVAVH